MLPAYVWVTCLSIYEPVCINSGFPTPAHPRELPLLFHVKNGHNKYRGKTKHLQVRLIYFERVQFLKKGI